MYALRIVLAGIAGAAALFLTGLPAGAGQAPHVPAHRHFLITPDGEVAVGPDACGNSRLQSAFNQFHASVHVGPANDAFDHDHNRVDVRGGAC